MPVLVILVSLILVKKLTENAVILAIALDISCGLHSIFGSSMLHQLSLYQPIKNQTCFNVINPFLAA